MVIGLVKVGDYWLLNTIDAIVLLIYGEGGRTSVKLCVEGCLLLSTVKRVVSRGFWVALPSIQVLVQHKVAS